MKRCGDEGMKGIIVILDGRKDGCSNRPVLAEDWR